MKANEAPEKIYFDGKSKACKLPVFSSQNIEYTRTDAFIEKAENFLEMLGYGFTITDNITHTSYGKEQLIEDFKKYMEE